MKAFGKWFEEKLRPAIQKFSQQKIIKSLNSGILNSLPLILIGVGFQVVYDLGLVFMSENPIVAKFGILNELTFGILGLFLAYSVASTSAKMNKVDPQIAGFVSVSLFLILMKAGVVQSEEGVKNFVVEFSRIGASGMFVSILSGILTGELLGLFSRKGWVIGKKLPDMIQKWFTYIIPSTILILIGWAVTHILNIDVHTMLNVIASPLVNILDSYLGMILYGLLGAFAWFLGFHPGAFLSLLTPFLFQNLAVNAQLYANGLAPTIENGFYIHNFGTIVGWCIIGGMGSFLGLNILMLFAKSDFVKSIGKANILPSIMNISEPIVFSLPIVYNFTLLIPMLIINGIVNPVLARFTMEIGFNTIPHTMSLVPFLPIGINGLLLNNDFKGVLVAIVLLIIDTAIWYPFFKIYDNQKLKEEAQEI